MTEIPTKQVLSPNLVKVGVGVSVLLVFAAGAAFYYASRYSQAERKAAADGAVTVTINAKSCDPNELTVPAGRTLFKIVNKSERAVEWEILDGVMVLEERENIAPGFTQTLTAKLEPGNYQITCGLLSNPRGVLHVTPSANGAETAAKPSMTAFIGAMAEYKVYLAGETEGFSTAVGDLAAAIKAGDLDKAKALYAPARIAYAHLSPIAGPISDLDSAIDARADYFDKKEQDPAFGGLHRIEYGLFAQNSLDGLAPVADKLSTDAAALADRIHDLRVGPDHMVAGAATVMDRFATAGAGLDEDRYAHIDLASLDAYLDGAQKVFDLIKPVVAKSNAALSGQIGDDFTALRDALAKYKAGDGFANYSTLSEDDKAGLKKQAGALAADLGKLVDVLRN